MTELAERQNDEEEFVPSFIQVDQLQKFGVNVADINKLKSGGIHTVIGVLMQTRKVQNCLCCTDSGIQTLTSIKGLSDQKVDKILDACHKLQVE